MSRRYGQAHPGNTGQRVIVGITGASGFPYADRLIECLLGAGKEVHLLVSSAARVVAAQEMSLSLPAPPARLSEWMCQRFEVEAGRVRVWGELDWFAPVASGSSQSAPMVVCPCSTGTLAAIASGQSDNLLERAADVALKERRTLILVPRESPFSTIHLENMLRLSRMGVIILPAAPGFYHRPDSVQDLIDFVVARILSQLRIDQSLLPFWGETRDPTIDSEEESRS